MDIPEPSSAPCLSPWKRPGKGAAEVQPSLALPLAALPARTSPHGRRCRGGGPGPGELLQDQHRRPGHRNGSGRRSHGAKLQGRRGRKRTGLIGQCRVNSASWQRGRRGQRGHGWWQAGGGTGVVAGGAGGPGEAGLEKGMDASPVFSRDMGGFQPCSVPSSGDTSLCRDGLSGSAGRRRPLQNPPVRPQTTDPNPSPFPPHPISTLIP